MKGRWREYMKKFFGFVIGTVLILIMCAISLGAFLVFIADEDTEDSTSSADSSGSGTIKYISDADAHTKEGFYRDGIIRQPQVKLKGNGEDVVTVLIYMNGSDLESEAQEATTDLSEMVAAGRSDKVNVVVQTMGTRSWSDKYAIASDRTQIYTVTDDGLTLVKDDLGQLDCTADKTLSDFIKWGAINYPADRYILLLWDHGGGPVYGFGYDEWNQDVSACLSADEIQTALRNSGVYFDIIGMDCCIMSCMEVACALYDYCDYAVLSEDFESGLGWSYTNWLSMLYKNSSVDSITLGKQICDDMVSANEDSILEGDESIMALIDEAMMKLLYKSWTEFAYANEDTLLNLNYSEPLSRKKGGRIHPLLLNKEKKSGVYDDIWDEYWDDSDSYDMADYYVTDIMAVAQNIDSEESKALASSVAQSLIYVRATSGDSSLTGMSVTIPYGDRDFYLELKTVFSNIGLDSDYIAWLEQFTSVPNSTGNYDYSDWSEDWDWNEYEDDYDWDDWSYDDDYWNDTEGWSDFDYDDSFNYWYENDYEDYDYYSFDSDDDYYYYYDDGDGYYWEEYYYYYYDG